MVRIIADSTCDLSPEMIERYQIGIVPLHVILGEEDYLDGKSITPDEIYAWSDANKATPKTAAISIEDHMEKATWIDCNVLSIMHYIPRSRGGLGVERNAALGCFYHHTMLDNGNTGRREEMLGLFKDYLMQQYEDWNEKELTYDKWSFLKQI